MLLFGKCFSTKFIVLFILCLLIGVSTDSHQGGLDNPIIFLFLLVDFGVSKLNLQLNSLSNKASTHYGLHSLNSVSLQAMLLNLFMIILSNSFLLDLGDQIFFLSLCIYTHVIFVFFCLFDLTMKLTNKKVCQIRNIFTGYESHRASSIQLAELCCCKLDLRCGRVVYRTS